MDRDNMAQIRDRDLLDAALERLIKWGVTAEIAEPEPTRLQVGVDARVRIRHGGREEVFTVEIKRGLRRETLGGGRKSVV